MTDTALQELIEQTVTREITDATPAALALVTNRQRCSTAVNCAPGNPPLFLAYSCTKTLIATLILMLCEEGHCTLESPLSRWFPSIPMASVINLLHLLNHTSGLPDYGGLDDYHREVRRSPSEPWTDTEFLERALGQGMLFTPGTGWAYSNIGYLLLKLIIMQETGQSLASSVAARICTPLGLTGSFITETMADLSVLQQAFSGILSEYGVSPVLNIYHPGWVSHGVLASTPDELASFYHRLFTGKVLSSVSRAAIVTLSPVSAALPRYRAPCYGLGIMADSASPYGVILGHNGVGPGYQASAFHLCTSEGRPLTVSAMCASECPGLAESIVFRVFEGLTAGQAP